MACIALTKESVVAVGFKKQADIDTVQAVADLFRLKWDSPLPVPAFNREDDGDDNTGTQNDYPTETFPLDRIIQNQLTGYLSAEKMAWAGGFNLGTRVSLTGAGPYQYTFVPMVRASAGCELPLFSLLHQIRGGAGSLPDDKYRSNAVVGFNVAIRSGPGRANSQITVDMLGIGVRDPDSDSGDTMPAATSEVLLPSASLALSVHGTDLVAARRIQSVDWGHQSPIETERMIFPGAGIDGNGYAYGGRMEFSKRQGNLSFVADFDESSTELATLRNGSTGTVVISQTNGTSGYTVTFHLVEFVSVTPTPSGRYLSLNVVCKPLWHASNGLMTLVVDTAVNNILTASV